MPKFQSQRLAGFTLVELMITVAIIGILTAVALPSYRDYVRRGQLPEATAALADYRIKMEQYFQDNRAYGAASCADGANAPAWGNFTPIGARNFTYACALNAGVGYIITATGREGTAAAGHVYEVAANGTQATTTFKGEGVSGRACWLIRGDEC